jgi:two-component system sensor histidine kinase BaeS
VKAALGAQDRLATMMAEAMGGGMGRMAGMGRGMEGMLGAPARAVVDGLRVNALLAALAAGLLALVAAVFVARRMAAPLAALADAAGRLERGERGIRLESGSGDELGRVTHAFNSLVAGLERQEAWRRNMVADVAHDLRTPVAVLRSRLEAMQDGLMPADAAGLAALHREAMRLGRLVEDLRTLSLAEGGGLNLKPVPTRLAPLLAQVVEDHAARSSAGASELRLGEIPPELEASLDPAATTRILDNLLENAVRYAPGALVEVGAEAAPDGLRVVVRDHGPGLSDEALARAFERFYRSDRARNRESGGSGLGLAIARALAEAQGARLEAANHPDGGAVFTLHLKG